MGRELPKNIRNHLITANRTSFNEIVWIYE